MLLFHPVSALYIATHSYQAPEPDINALLYVVDNLLKITQTAFKGHYSFLSLRYNLIYIHKKVTMKMSYLFEDQ